MRWQVARAAPFPIEEAQVSYVPGAARRRTARSSSSRWRGATSSPSTKRCARTAGAHAGLVDLATFNVVNAVLAGRGAPPGDWLLVNVAPDYASIAILRGRDLIFFRNRGADGEGHARRPRAPDRDVLRGPPAGRRLRRVVLAGAATGRAIRPRRRRSCAAASRSASATPVETVDPRTAAALTDRITRGPALLDALAPLVGLLLRDATGGGVIRTNLSTRPFYNERARPRLAAGARGRGRRRGHAVQRARGSLRYSRSDTRAGDAGRRATKRAPRDLRARRRAAARAASTRARSRRSSADAREANELIDRRTFSWTELFNRFETTLPDRRADHGGAAAGRSASGSIILTITVVARSVDDVDQFIENLEAHRRVQQPAPAQEQHERGRPARVDARGGLRAASAGSRATRGDRSAGDRRSSADPRREACADPARSLVAARRQRARLRHRRASAGAKSAGAADRARRGGRARAAGGRARLARPRRWSPARRAPTGAERVLQQGAAGRPSRARRLTYAQPAGAGAQEPTSRYEARHRCRTRRRDDKRARPHARSRMVLQGDYENIRQFIYELETSPEFVDHRRCRRSPRARADEAL